MSYIIRCNGQELEAEEGAILRDVLQGKDIHVDSPCGGNGTCKKCKVICNGEEVLACKTEIHCDMTVILPETADENVLTTGASKAIVCDGTDKYVIAFDIGTTTVVGYLLDGHTGAELAVSGIKNPQTAYGADVISRIQYAGEGGAEELKNVIRSALSSITIENAKKAGIKPEEITGAAIVGNTCMHHLYMGIDTSSLVIPPYMPNVFDEMTIPAKGVLPINENGEIRILPNIAGFVGADTVGCLSSVIFDETTDWTLLIDIGTNGEMVLGKGNNRICCSTAAGPAFEGAKIEMGMRGAPGAIDHVTFDGNDFICSVIGDVKAEGICGSGLLDAVNALLEADLIGETGTLCHDERFADRNITLPEIGKAFLLKDGVYITQKDIREVQLAKSAIRCGIELMAKQRGIEIEDISVVLLAGAFGSHMSPKSACGIGMLPPILIEKVVSIGNAAGEGSKRCALSKAEFKKAEVLAKGTDFLELASLPEFQDNFVDRLMFCEDDD